ncbi:MAG: PepSY-associated TM helix domain-containing protein [Vicinamibacterales bacterium]
MRKLFFWLHLSAGVIAGLIILVMSITGVVLTYERQIGEWSRRSLRSAPPGPDAARLPVETLLAHARRDFPDRAVTGLTLSARRDAPAVLAAEPEPLYLDAYTGASLGSPEGEGVRAFLAATRSWHRWLAAEGDGRALGRAITGWSNLLFLFIVVSGMYLWIPRVWTHVQFRSVVWFRRRYGSSKARDFNWHNVIGIWSAIPLFIVVLGAVPISFPWASDAIYRLVGEAPPVRGGRPAGPPRQRREGRPPSETAASIEGLNGLWARAEASQSDWKTINLRFPRRDRDPLVFSIDRGNGGQPQLRSTLTLDRAGAVVDQETFSDQTLGRQIRSVLRFAHTGEVLGVTGQTVAGLASAGAVVMVWTGLALSWRRWRAWAARGRTAVLSSPVSGDTSSARQWTNGAAATAEPNRAWRQES